MISSEVEVDFDLLISQQQINERLKIFAQQIDKDYSGKEIKLIMIMKGAICFVADFIRCLDTSFTLDYLRCSSYTGTQQHELKIFGLEDLDIVDKHVLIVDDIFDTGKTISEVVRKVSEKEPASIRSLVLLSRQSDKRVAYRPEYSLFDIAGDAFVVGYGLDYHERYRGMPGVYTLKSL